MQICAVIVARGESQRVPNKAMARLGGTTLLGHKIQQLLRCHTIDRIIVGSDSTDILQEAIHNGAEAVKRQDYYCNEDICSANEMIKNMCSLITTDIVVWAHCTNPLLSSDTYDRAVKLFLSKQGQYDSLLSVVALREHLWNANATPLNYDPYAPRHTLAKELSPLYMQDGGIFIQPHKQMQQNAYFFGYHPFLFEIPPEEFLDINEPRDLIVARALLNNK